MELLLGEASRLRPPLLRIKDPHHDRPLLKIFGSEFLKRGEEDLILPFPILQKTERREDFKEILLCQELLRAGVFQLGEDVLGRILAEKLFRLLLFQEESFLRFRT